LYFLYCIYFPSTLFAHPAIISLPKKDNLTLSYPCISAKIECWVDCKNDGNLLLLY
jgi:hypothetical protein